MTQERIKLLQPVIKVYVYHMTTSKLLPCKVGAGMFSSEVAVELETDGTVISMFVDKGLVVTKGDQSYLLVTEVGENGKPHHKTVLLPQEPFETGSPWLSVPENLLQTA
jgi:hypothetical protein